MLIYELYVLVLQTQTCKMILMFAISRFFLEFSAIFEFFFTNSGAREFSLGFDNRVLL